MRSLALDEVLVIAGEILRLDIRTVRNVTILNVLDSAIHAPDAGFGDFEAFPTLAEKAAVLASRIMRNHPFPDGNKRVAFFAMLELIERNGGVILFDDDDVVNAFERTAAGEWSEQRFIDWLKRQL